MTSTTVLSLALLLTVASASASLHAHVRNCEHILDAPTRSSIHALIKSSPVALIAMKNVRCTIAAQRRLESSSTCYKSRIFTDPRSKLWKYMRW